MITDTLKITLANHIEASLILQGYHWNIEGFDFNQYHQFFSDIYEDYYDQVDRLAEYVRIVSSSKEYINSTVDLTKLNKTITADIIVGAKQKEMCLAIIVINDALLANYTDLFAQATKENIQGLANYCAERMDALTKWRWKLVASTK